MYKIKKIRRKILVDGEYKIIPLWECIVKFGTHGSTIMYLFDEPKDGINTRGLKWEYNTPLYCLPILRLRVEKVRSDNFVILYLE